MSKPTLITTAIADAIRKTFCNLPIKVTMSHEK